MDAAVNIDLPSLDSPATAFDLSLYYHDLQVVPTSLYPGCEPACLTNGLYLVDSSTSGAFELAADLNTLSIGQVTQLKVKAGWTDASLVGSYFAIWVIKD